MLSYIPTINKWNLKLPQSLIHVKVNLLGEPCEATKPRRMRMSLRVRLGLQLSSAITLQLSTRQMTSLSLHLGICKYATTQLEGVHRLLFTQILLYCNDVTKSPLHWSQQFSRAEGRVCGTTCQGVFCHMSRRARLLMPEGCCWH